MEQEIYSNDENALNFNDFEDELHQNPSEENYDAYLSEDLGNDKKFTYPSEKSKEPIFNLFTVRILACVLIFCGIFILKLNNKNAYAEFQNWYASNVCRESFSIEEIQSGAENVTRLLYDKFLGIYNTLSEKPQIDFNINL